MTTHEPQQLEVNDSIWRRGDHVAEYANRTLLPVEVVILVRYREALSGRVLEAGCGGGRILGYLVTMGGEVHGIDISPAMVAHCRAAYPRAQVRVGDLGALADSVEGPFDAVLAADNVLDVFDDAKRLAVLGDIRRLLGPGGLLIFSSHNLASLDGDPGSGSRRLPQQLLVQALSQPLGRVLRYPVRAPRRIRNRRRLAPLQHRGADHAIVNDAAHDYSLLHYYIGRDDQARQLTQTGYELLECLDPEGATIHPGETSRSPWLHYVARAA